MNNPDHVLGATEIPAGAVTVGELNGAVERVLRESAGQFPEYVVGETVETSEYPFGTFFDLQDVASDPVISCVVWADTLSSIEYELQSGTEVVVEATVDFYPDRGDCQLLVSDFWPVGESDRREELAAVRERLTAEGIFADEHKQTLPEYPQCVGVVTSPTGSAREDVCTAISDRSPRADVKLAGATVQGDRAVPSMVAGLTRVDADPDTETIVLTRGGGADTDLWCFNAEPLVRCVADCSTPVIVAVGHEDDDTLVERVADVRAMTPTEAGVVATTPATRTLEDLRTLERRVEETYTALLETELKALDRRIGTAVTTIQHRQSQRESVRERVSEVEQRITAAYAALVERRLHDTQQRIERAFDGVTQTHETSVRMAKTQREQLADLEARIDTAYQSRVNTALTRLDRRINIASVHRQAEIRTAEVHRLRIAVVAVVLIFVAVVLGIAVV